MAQLSAAHELPPGTESNPYRIRAIRLYKMYNRDKLGQVEEALKAFWGNWDEMMSRLTNAYGPEPSPEDYRMRLQRFYTVYDPSKMNKVDVALKSFQGYEEDMFCILVSKYGLEPEPPTPRAEEIPGNGTGTLNNMPNRDESREKIAQYFRGSGPSHMKPTPPMASNTQPRTFASGPPIVGEIRFNGIEMYLYDAAPPERRQRFEEAVQRCIAQNVMQQLRHDEVRIRRISTPAFTVNFELPEDKASNRTIDSVSDTLVTAVRTGRFVLGPLRSSYNTDLKARDGQIVADAACIFGARATPNYEYSVGLVGAATTALPSPAMYEEAHRANSSTQLAKTYSGPWSPSSRSASANAINSPKNVRRQLMANSAATNPLSPRSSPGRMQVYRSSPHRISRSRSPAGGAGQQRQGSAFLDEVWSGSPLSSRHRQASQTPVGSGPSFSNGGAAAVDTDTRSRNVNDLLQQVRVRHNNADSNLPEYLSSRSRNLTPSASMPRRTQSAPRKTVDWSTATGTVNQGVWGGGDVQTPREMSNWSHPNATIHNNMIPRGSALKGSTGGLNSPAVVFRPEAIAQPPVERNVPSEGTWRDLMAASAKPSPVSSWAPYATLSTPPPPVRRVEVAFPPMERAPPPQRPTPPPQQRSSASLPDGWLSDANNTSAIYTPKSRKVSPQRQNRTPVRRCEESSYHSPPRAPPPVGSRAFPPANAVRLRGRPNIRTPKERVGPDTPPYLMEIVSQLDGAESR